MPDVKRMITLCVNQFNSQITTWEGIYGSINYHAIADQAQAQLQALLHQDVAVEFSYGSDILLVMPVLTIRFEENFSQEMHLQINKILDIEVQNFVYSNNDPY